MNSIYAHEGLMNSLGHRKNILNTHFDYLGVGVYFNDRRQPFLDRKLYKLNVYIYDLWVNIVRKDVDKYEAKK